MPAKRAQTSFLISTISQVEWMVRGYIYIYEEARELGNLVAGQGKSASLVQLAGQVLAGCQVAAF